MMICLISSALRSLSPSSISCRLFPEVASASLAASLVGHLGTEVSFVEDAAAIPEVACREGMQQRAVATLFDDPVPVLSIESVSRPPSDLTIT